MSRTGNRRQRGFTLIEVMATVAILSLGTVFICQSNLTSMSVYGRSLNRLKIQNFAEQKMWEGREAVFSQDPPSTNTTNGVVRLDGKDYRWELAVQATDSEDFYEIKLNASWDEGSQNIQLARFGMVYKPTDVENT